MVTTEYSGGLEKILQRRRLFLIDTNVLFCGQSGANQIQDNIERLAADLTARNELLIHMQATHDVIQQYDNVRVTPEVYNEILCKVGYLVAHYKSKRGKRKLTEKVYHYFRKHQGELVVGSYRWKPAEMTTASDMLQEEFTQRYHKLKELSEADISLLLKALEFLLADKGSYQKTDIISSDYGVLKGAELMFEILDELPVGTEKSKRIAQHRCMKVISREFREEYHDVFNSEVYCRQLRENGKIRTY